MSSEELSAEWVRVASYYNRVRAIGSPNWGDLELDVKRSWRERYRDTQKVGREDAAGMPGVSREYIKKWLALSGTEEEKMADYIPPEVTVKADEVNHPSHYTDHPSGVECIQITEHLSFLRGNAIKYLWRAGKKKDAIVDLEKAVFYIQREIQNLKTEWENRDD